MPRYTPTLFSAALTKGESSSPLILPGMPHLGIIFPDEISGRKEVWKAWKHINKYQTLFLSVHDLKWRHIIIKRRRMSIEFVHYKWQPVITKQMSLTHRCIIWCRLIIRERKHLAVQLLCLFFPVNFWFFCLVLKTCQNIHVISFGAI